MSSNLPSKDGDIQPQNTQTIEERSFQVALLIAEGHFAEEPPIGPKSLNRASDMIAKTMSKTLALSEVRQTLGKNVDIWLRLQIVFLQAVPSLSARSLHEDAPDTASGDIPDTITLIANNYTSLLQDLRILNDLLVIARNMLAIREIAQEICAATQLDEEIHRLIDLCINVTRQGYDGENADVSTRTKVNEITEYYKKLLITSLQLLHNLTMGNDYLKMKFLFDVIFDSHIHTEEIPPDGPDPELVYSEMRHWLERNPPNSSQTKDILDEHEALVPYGKTAGPLPAPLYQDNREQLENIVAALKKEAKTIEEVPEGGQKSVTPIWKDIHDKRIQDALYGRVSHAIDIWWKRVRDPNYDAWVVKMETVENAKARAEVCKANAMTRYMPSVEQESGSHVHNHDHDHYHEAHHHHHSEHPSLHPPHTHHHHDHHHDHEHDHDHDHEHHHDHHHDHDHHHHHHHDHHHDHDLDGDELDEEDEDDDDSYIEAPLRGVLTEIPNILDAKQIEALHMTIKGCIVDHMGNGLTKYGENLQKTRCKIFLAVQCGKNLLREMLVFIAVWEQAESDFIFQITAQIIESFHHNALVPYAWDSLRILKDIVSPAQTVLLRLINYMFRARKNTAIYSDQRDYQRDAKLIHFLYNYFRCRVVPDCIALLYAQTQIRNGKAFAQDFPVDLWDMERAKDGLWQYLDFLSTVADIPEMRPLLIEWDATYELITLLDALDGAVPRKPLVDPLPPRNPNDPFFDPDAPRIVSNETIAKANRGAIPTPERPYDDDTASTDNNHDSLPPLHDRPHEFPWSGVKVQIMIILTTLVSPEPGAPGDFGNPVVQQQVLKHAGMPALLNCLAYDGHNMFLKERATLCLKWVTGGSEEAQRWVKELVPVGGYGSGFASPAFVPAPGSGAPVPVPGPPKKNAEERKALEGGEVVEVVDVQVEDVATAAVKGEGQGKKK